jgi:hypothetical protein
LLPTSYADLPSRAKAGIWVATVLAIFLSVVVDNVCKKQKKHKKVIFLSNFEITTAILNAEDILKSYTEKRAITFLLVFLCRNISYLG